ncbi:MAG: 50S ribosomal protein L18 [Candidatus Aenigmatarchaeota archaeon]
MNNDIKRRRKEKKTDYNQRLKLLKSGEPRLVVRKSNNHTRIQLTAWKEDGDEVLARGATDELEEFGWKGHTGNLPAAYLAGYLMGQRAQEKGIDKCILDIGLQKNTQENRIYAAVKGVRDAGVEVPVSEEMIPSEERIQGKHIEEHASEMNEGEKKEKFSGLIEKGFDPEKITQNFENVKQNIGEE